MQNGATNSDGQTGKEVEEKTSTRGDEDFVFRCVEVLRYL